MSATRVGFIGLGHISIHAHLPGLAPLVEAGDVELSAFCDISEAALSAQAAAFGAKATYTDHHEMFDREELDAVYINLPPTLHTDQVTIAADKGIAVFVEKPVSLDMAQAVAFSQQVDKAGIVSQVGFMSRYYPSSEKVCQLLAERTPRHVMINLFYSGKPVRWWTSRYEECGGSFVENTVHMVDLLRYFLGDIADVSAFYQWRQRGEGPEMMNMPHVYDVNYRFASGVVGNATTSRVLTNADGAGRREVVLVCDDAMIEWSTGKVMENSKTVFEEETQGRSAFALQARAFIAAVKAGDKSLMRSPYGPSLNSLAAVLGANASAERDGERLSLADVQSGRVAWNPLFCAGHGTPTLDSPWGSRPAQAAGAGASMITEEAVWGHLRQLQDPMFGEPLSVVDVGMIETVRVTGTAVHVSIRMFNRGRVHIDAAASPIRSHLLQLEGVTAAAVEAVWDAAWTPDRLSPKARQVLGFTSGDPPEGAMHVRAAERADPQATALDSRHLGATRVQVGRQSQPLSELSRDRFRPYWGGWRSYKRVTLKETGGRRRCHEPVHLDVSFTPGQLRDPVREIRLVAAESGQEIPCQVYRPHVAADEVSCSVVFFADVEAHEDKTYLLLHNNPSPACWQPFYPTGLVTRGEGCALQIDNGTYRARLSPVMGQLRNLVFCRWGQTRLGWEDPSPLSLVDADNDPHSKLDIAWHGEDDCIHWNPDFRNQLRYRMTNWPQAPNFTVDQGALCTIVRRWGYPVCPTHPARDQSAVCLDVTYTFYDGLPYFTMTSALRVEQEADILVVRNDEWLFRQSFSHSLHMHEGGAIIRTPAAGNISFASNPAMVGFVDQAKGDAFVSLRLAFDARGFPGAYDPRWLTLGTTDYGNQLWSRDVFHESREQAVQPGAFVSESNAYVCLNVEDGGVEQVATWYDLLRAPLQGVA